MRASDEIVPSRGDEGEGGGRLAVPPRRTETSLRTFATFLVAVVVATSAFTAISFVALGPKPERPLRIVDVSVAPATPIPEQGLTVLSTVEGGSQFHPVSVWLFHAASYRNEIVSASRMTSLGEGGYRAAIGPFANGAEVWIVVAAMTSTQGPVFSQHLVLAVGVVVKDPGSLVVESVTHTPPAPGPSTPVSVFAQIQTMTFVTKVFLTYGWFARTTVGAGYRFMGTQDGVTYESPIDETGFGRSFPPGTVFFYRVAAIDAVGVSADSGILSFTIS